MQLTFNSMFLGSVDKLIETVTDSFPELGIQESDCSEMSWIESVLFFDGYPKGASSDVLVDRGHKAKSYFNAKSDYVQEPIPEEKLEDIWKWCLEGDNPVLIMEPHGGKMDEIDETSIPYPHRKWNLYSIQYFEQWQDDNTESSKKRISQNDNANNTSYLNALEWGSKYFGDNFRRLALVKGVVDPDSFFFYEQSIPRAYE
ncbi:hypothetical protein M8C21_017425 [Ambrosia artemisiifolia]|uniref:Berberine/berberine-like domain-containing protein n=1 Tax=Ambrosia artemisiifolia TaxID=4212 RepID=A0AAD5G6T9_AMBAR|nr:hypothetical protein M8C21_017425 [Ambrosia artemisiifolia]